MSFHCLALELPLTLLYTDSSLSYPKITFRLSEFVFVSSHSHLRSFALCILFSWTSAALLQAQTKPLTVSAIFTDPGFTADAPTGMAWSPDSSRMTYLNANGDLVAVAGDSGTTSVLDRKSVV